MTGIAQLADAGSLRHSNVSFLIERIHTSDPIRSFPRGLTITATTFAHPTPVSQRSPRSREALSRSQCESNQVVAEVKSPPSRDVGFTHDGANVHCLGGRESRV